MNVLGHPVDQPLPLGNLSYDQRKHPHYSPLPQPPRPIVHRPSRPSSTFLATRSKPSKEVDYIAKAATMASRYMLKLDRAEVGGGGGGGGGSVVARGVRNRPILRRVNTNVDTSSLLTARTVNRSSTLPKALAVTVSIPRPVSIPDVFAPVVPIGVGASDTVTVSNLGKRPRDTTLAAATANPLIPTKRARIESTNTAKKIKEEQKQWLHKWRKAFPTLIFHFDIEVDENACKKPRERVLKMGSKIEQFFSQGVSHLIINSAPKKTNKPLRESLKNPYVGGVISLAEKAEAMGIKVWTVKKLVDMLDQLAPLAQKPGETLENLLEDERLHGTRERDLSAPRPGYYYFRPGNKYLLVGDAASKHRPIMVKEYSSKEQGWPILYETFLRAGSSTDLNVATEDIRARAVALYVDRVPFRGEEPPIQTLKRSSSLHSFTTNPIEVEEIPYEKASGNSVTLTSNIASTSNSGTPGHLAGGVVQLGARKDRAIMQLSKRVLTGNALLAASNNKTTDAARRRASTGTTNHDSIKERMTPAQVLSMLQQLRAPTTVPKPTFIERQQHREEVDAGCKRTEQDVAAGYCENCRVRFTNLSLHAASKKHRRFAMDPKNFRVLDEQLYCLRRPPNPIICQPSPVCLPCNSPHGPRDECNDCSDESNVFSSPQASVQVSPQKSECEDDGDYVFERTSEIINDEAKGE